MSVKTLVSSIGLEVQSRVIPGTYTDLWKAKDFLLLSMFDADNLDQKIRSQSINAKDRVNTFLGRQTDFTEAELLTTPFCGIVSAASQMTSCFVQRNPQSARMDISEDTLIDCAEALITLTNWALNNGILPPDKKAKEGHILTELPYFYNDVNEVI